MTDILLNNSQVKVNSIIGPPLDPAHVLTAVVVARNPLGVQAIAEHYTTLGFQVESRKIDIRLTGAVALFERAFQTQFHTHTWKGNQHYSNCSNVTVPNGLQIAGVLGLDDFPIFKPHCSQPTECTDHDRHVRVHATAHSKPTPVPIRHSGTGLPPIRSNAAASYFLPTQVASIYSFPGNTGSGQTIGIIELGGMFSQTDLNNYFADFNLGTAPTIDVRLVDGATQINEDATFEVALDVDVIAAIVPDATIRVYFGVNSMAGFYNCIQAAGLQCNIVSVSWGLDEAGFLSTGGFVSSYQSLFDSLGVTILVSSGDDGSTGLTGSGFHVSFPASVPSCLSCGGTTLSYDLGLDTFLGETAWSGSGGGYSIFYSRPSYQDGIVSNSARGQPDICGNANPSTGYVVSNAGYYVIGGTSAVSPLWAALIAQMNYVLGTPLGICNSTLYSLSSSVYRDVTAGNNGGFNASSGWDPVTGLGAPHGNLILAAIQGSSLIVSSLSPSTGSQSGGTTVTMIGVGFNSVTNVSFGGTNGTLLVIISDTRLTVVTPSSSTTGTVNVVVVGSSVVTKTNAFTYTTAPIVSSISPEGGPIRNNRTRATITGVNLASVTRVVFGSSAASIVSKSATSIVVRVPKRNADGAVTVTITNSGGSGSTQFTYFAPIKLQSLKPSKGTRSGGTTVRLRGSQLNQIAGATLGGGDIVLSGNSTAVTFTTPAHTKGSTNLVASNAFGYSYRKTKAFKYL